MPQIGPARWYARSNAQWSYPRTSPLFLTAQQTTPLLWLRGTDWSTTGTSVTGLRLPVDSQGTLTIPLGRLSSLTGAGQGFSRVISRYGDRLEPAALDTHRDLSSGQSSL